MSTSNNFVNALLRLSQFSDPYTDPTDNKIIITDVIVDLEKNDRERCWFYLEPKEKAKKSFKNWLKLSIL